jgi:preprotein translocase subunit Sec61beta
VKLLQHSDDLAWAIGMALAIVALVIACRIFWQ